MAVSFTKALGTFNTKAASATDIPVTTTLNCVSDQVIVAIFLFDNAGTASKPVISSISKPGGETNSWVALGAARSTSTSAGAFSSGEMWAIKTTMTWPSGTVVTATLDTAVTMRAGMLQEFDGVNAILRSTSGTAYSTTTTAASAVTGGTAPVIGDLALGFLFGSNFGSAVTGDTDSTGGTWSAVTGLGTTGGSSTTNNFGVFQYKVVTATSQQTFNNAATMTAGNGSIVAILQAAPKVTQSTHQWFADGTEAGASSLAATGVDLTADLTAGDMNLAVRMRLQETNGAVVPATVDWQLQYEKNASGTWVDVTAGGSNVVPYASANLTDAAATTNRLGAGTGSFVAGKLSEDGLIDNLGWSASNYTEVLYSVTLKAADLANADALEFRVVKNDAAVELVYTVGVPSVLVTKVATHAGAVVLADVSTLTVAAEPLEKVGAVVLADVSALSVAGTVSTPGGGPVTYVGAGTFTEAAVANFTIPYPTGIVADDYLVMMMGNATNAVLGSQSGWTTVFTKSSTGDTAAPNLYMGIKKAVGTESGTSFTTNMSGTSARSGQILAFRNVDLVTPQDVTVSFLDKTTTVDGDYDIPSLTTTRTGTALVYAAGANVAGGTFTPPTVPATFTETGDRISGAARTMGYRLWSGSGATGIVNLLYSGTARGLAGLIAFRPASGGGPTTHAGAVNISSDSDLTVAGITERIAAALIATVSALTVAAQPPEKVGAVAIASTSTLTSDATVSAGVVTHAGASTISSTSVLTVAAQPPEKIGIASIASTSTLTVAGITTRVAAVNIVSSTTLTVGALVTKDGATTIASTSTLTVSALTIRIAAATSASTSTLTVAAVTIRIAAVNISSTSALVADGTISTGPVTYQGVVTITSSSVLTVAGIVTGLAAATIASTSTLTVAALVTKDGAVLIASTSTLTASASVIKLDSVTSASVSTLTVTGITTRIAAVTSSSTSTLTVAALVTKDGAAVIASSSTLTVAALVTKVGVVAIASSSTLTVAALVTKVGVVAIASTSTLTVAAIVTKDGAAVIASTSLLTVAGVITRLAQVLISSSSTTTATGKMTSVAFVNISSISQLIVALTLIGTRTGQLKSYTGGAGDGWNGRVAAKLWNGSTWVEHPFKAWNGSTWVLAK